MKLGNLSIDEFIRRTGYDISDEDKKILELHRQDGAYIEPLSNNFHIFDVPFSIDVAKPFSTKLLTILQKYENIATSKEAFTISSVYETEEEKQKRAKREQKDKEWNDKVSNPNSVWNVKWHMCVPVVVDNKELYYRCFINTYTKGKENIPDIIDGKGKISYTEDGFNGFFTLYNPEKDDNANEHSDWNYVIGNGYVTKSGIYKGKLDNVYFDEVEFSIKDCIENYKQLFNTTATELHFDRFKED